ncbi:MAG: hypothetical protein MUD10_04900 [Candidatus Pacebacteria bacterium]|jgi:hypothetical protein|nr:hypothetical protein [Candidatus Paceibacterota bacterium]
MTSLIPQINLWEIIKGVFEWAFAFIWLLIKIIWPAWPLFLVFAVILAVKYYFERSKTDIVNRQNQHQPTSEARELAKLLEGYGWHPELEKWDGFKHIDIAITSAKVNIEVDGRRHDYSQKQALADLKRSYYSFKKGYITLRIPNVLVHDTAAIRETAEFIDKFLRESDHQLNG